MNKRLLKRHKRQVSRERERVKRSEPDVRTPEEQHGRRAALLVAAATTLTPITPHRPSEITLALPQT